MFTFNSSTKSLRTGALALGLLIALSGCGDDVMGPGGSHGSDVDWTDNGQGDGSDVRASMTVQFAGREVSFRDENLTATYEGGVFTLGGSQANGTNGVYDSFLISVASSAPGDYETPSGVLTANFLWLWDFSADPDDPSLLTTLAEGGSGRITVESISDSEIRGHFVGSLSCGCDEANVQVSGSFWAEF